MTRADALFRCLVGELCFENKFCCTFGGFLRLPNTIDGCFICIAFVSLRFSLALIVKFNDQGGRLRGLVGELCFEGKLCCTFGGILRLPNTTNGCFFSDAFDYLHISLSLSLKPSDQGGRIVPGPRWRATPPSSSLFLTGWATRV